MSHTVTVTQIFCDPEGESDDAEYTIGGEHDYRCSVWYPCAVDGCEADDEGEFHGIEHIISEGIDGYCTQRSGECGLTFAFEYDNPEFQMDQLGTFDIDIEWDGDNWTASLSRIPQDARIEGESK